MADDSIPDPVELTRRRYEAWNRRDFEALFSFLSPDVVFRPMPSVTDSRERRGREDVVRFYEEFFEVWADDFTIQAESIREYGDAVIALARFRGHAKASGIEVAGAVFEVARFRDGTIDWVEHFTVRAEAVNAARAAG
jgi:ketosteroid isomerase-like protein